MALLYQEETYHILGACFEVYKEKGCGFLEAVYQECLEIELKIRGIPFQSQKPLDIRYKGNTLTQIYRPDFVCFDKIILEIKATKVLHDQHRAQLINYIRATDLKLGILLNFGHYPKLEYHRIVV